MRVSSRPVLAAIVLGLTAFAAGPLQAREIPLGSITYEARPEREVINVGGREGEFRGFRFEVRQSDVEVLDLRIVYGNGQTEDVRVRQLFRAGSSSRLIELGSPRRALKQIIINYLPRARRASCSSARTAPEAVVAAAASRGIGCGWAART